MWHKLHIFYGKYSFFLFKTGFHLSGLILHNLDFWSSCHHLPCHTGDIYLIYVVLGIKHRPLWILNNRPISLSLNLISSEKKSKNDLLIYICVVFKIPRLGQTWWHTLKRQRQKDLCKFVASLQSTYHVAGQPGLNNPPHPQTKAK